MAADDDDRGLLAELGDVLADPVPLSVLEAARATFTWRTIDAELVALLESAEELTAGVRSAAAAETLLFSVDDVTIELWPNADPPGVSGYVLPAGPATVELRVGDGARHTVEADELGQFEIDLPAPLAGPVSLRLVLDDGRAVVTDWTVL